MNNKAVTLIVLANLAALVLLAIFLPHLMISPGKLIDAHAELATDCFACHSPFVGSTPRKCIECHKVAEIGITTTKGLPIGKEKKNVAFHQKLLAEDCVACHSDHKGVKAFRPISQFSHRLLQPQVQEQCDGCHSMPGDALHQKLKGNCGTCHTQERWKPATFDHERYFRFDKHHTTDCQTCHVSSDYGSYTCYVRLPRALSLQDPRGAREGGSLRLRDLRGVPLQQGRGKTIAKDAVARVRITRRRPWCLSERV